MTARLPYPPTKFLPCSFFFPSHHSLPCLQTICLPTIGIIIVLLFPLVCLLSRPLRPETGQLMGPGARSSPSRRISIGERQDEGRSKPILPPETWSGIARIATPMYKYVSPPFFFLFLQQHADLVAYYWITILCKHVEEGGEPDEIRGLPALHAKLQVCVPLFFSFLQQHADLVACCRITILCKHVKEGGSLTK